MTVGVASGTWFGSKVMANDTNHGCETSSPLPPKKENLLVGGCLASLRLGHRGCRAFDFPG